METAAGADAPECESPVTEPAHLERNAHGERRTRVVVGLTFVMMVAEVGLGELFHSMALVADGWHMGGHVAALGITLFAYWHARRHKDDPRFSFGTGKVGALGGFASGATLGFVALMLAGECIEKIFEPEPIRFDEALTVACVGLVANLVSAWLLAGHELGAVEGADHGHAHGSGHGHAQGHGHAHGHDDREHRHLVGHDHNLRAAYLHVLADALTSLLAIVALLAGRYLGWTVLDPLVGLVACFVILRWTLALLRQGAVTLLDQDDDPARTRALRAALEKELGARVVDLHVWTVAPGVAASMITVESARADARERAREVAQRHGPFTHLTLEVRTPTA